MVCIASGEGGRIVEGMDRAIRVDRWRLNIKLLFELGKDGWLVVWLRNVPIIVLSYICHPLIRASEHAREQQYMCHEILRGRRESVCWELG